MDRKPRSWVAEGRAAPFRMQLNRLGLHPGGTWSLSWVALFIGGIAFEATGSYDWMWYADIALAVFAALINLPIREPRAPQLAAA